MQDNFWTQALLSAIVMNPDPPADVVGTLWWVPKAYPRRVFAPEAGSRTLGVHLRRGDGCTVSLRAGKCVPLARYRATVRTLAKAYSITHVYIATDDVNFTRPLVEDVTAMGLQWSLSERMTATGDAAASRPAASPELATATDWIEKRLQRGEIDRKAALVRLPVHAHLMSFRMALSTT